MSQRPIRFFHRGAIVEANPASATRTVLEWLREEALCTGTKEGCAEGDCGACTVVVGELGANGALEMKPVNACIRFLPTLDGKALFTVEDVTDLGAAAGENGNGIGSAHGSSAPLHPAQQAMVDCHGSQCGFCTPGFVMSLWSCYERHQAAGTRPSRQQLADDLSGNLCRCTGYRPILDAGQAMFEVHPRVSMRHRCARRCRRWPLTRRWIAPTSTPRARSPRWPRCACSALMRACSPVALTSACG